MLIFYLFIFYSLVFETLFPLLDFSRLLKNIRDKKRMGPWAPPELNTYTHYIVKSKPLKEELGWWWENVSSCIKSVTMLNMFLTKTRVQPPNL